MRSTLSKKLAGAVFPNILQGESKPLIHEGGLTKDQCAEKEKQIFDHAMENTENGYCSNITLNNSDVTVQTVCCNEDDLIFQDYDKVKEFLGATLHEIHEYPHEKSICDEMFRQVDRHHNETTYVRWSDRSCCCEFQSKQLEEFLQKMSYRLPAPSKDTLLKEHFQTSKANYY